MEEAIASLGGPLKNNNDYHQRRDPKADESNIIDDDRIGYKGDRRSKDDNSKDNRGKRKYRDSSNKDYTPEHQQD